MSSNMSVITVRVKAEVKQKAIENAEAAGLSLSEVINAFLVKLAAEGVAPFQIGASETPNEVTAAAMKDADEGRVTRCESIADMYAKAGIEKPSAHAQS